MRAPETPCEGPLDIACSRLVHLALAHRDPGAVSTTLRHLGIEAAGVAAGAEPSAADRERDRRRVKEFARACGPPASLAQAGQLVEHHLPASGERVSKLLITAGLTVGPMTPQALRHLSLLFGLPAPTWLTVVRPRRHDTHDPVPPVPGTVPLLVGPHWARQKSGLAAVLTLISRRGAVPTEEATDLLRGGTAWAGMPDAGILDVLTAWALHNPGSPIVWDRGRRGALLRPVQRALAVCGPLPVNVLRQCVNRAGSASGPDVVPTVATLQAWAAEHPGTRVLPDGRVSLARPNDRRLADMLTGPDLVMVRVLRRAGGPLPGVLLRDRLLHAGVVGTPGSAATAVRTAPFLIPAGRHHLDFAGKPEPGDDDRPEIALREHR